MDGKVEVTLEGLDDFLGIIEGERYSLVKRLERAIWEILFRLQRDAKRRVPVEFGTLRNNINIDVDTSLLGNVTGEIGPPTGKGLFYANYLEYGTRFIAGGRVKALGDGDDITDADAIKQWPAKNAGFINEKTGELIAPAALRAAEKSAQSGSGAEQMPWLRPAVNKNEAWIHKKILQAVQQQVPKRKPQERDQFGRFLKN